MERRLSASDVLSTTVAVLARSFPAFFVVAALCTMPAVALDAWLLEWRIDEHVERTAALHEDYYYVSAGEDELLRQSVLAMLLSGLIAAFCIAATQAGVLYAVVEELAGRRPSLAAAIGRPLTRMPAALGAMVLVSCVVLFGSTCLAVPAIALASLFYFAVPAAVIEELSPFRAVARSVDLTKGNRALVLGLVFAIVAVFAAVRFGLRALWGAPPLLALEVGDMPASGPAWSYFVMLGLVAVAEAMILAVLSSVMYARLRQRDGIDVDALAEVFA